METIQHAAIKYDNGNVYLGRVHHDCFIKAKHKEARGTSPCIGFLTSEGRFVDKQEAYRIAITAKQVRSKALDSEDLWFWGPYSYDKENGYTKI